MTFKTRLSVLLLSTPVLAYEVQPRTRLDTLPGIVASPRAAAVFGQDSVVPVYVEGYGPGGAAAPTRVAVHATVRAPGGAPLWRDTATLERRTAPPAVRPASSGAVVGAVGGGPAAASALALYSGVLRVPVSRAGIGIVQLDVVRRDAAAAGLSAPVGGAGPDSVRAPLFISLGDELPVASFEEMVSYLRYFATPERLRALRDSSPERRAAAWSAFLRETDPVRETAPHEALQEYLVRLRAASTRFREEGVAGWLTDRGMAYVALGEPDQILDPNTPDQHLRGRTQVWEYREPRTSLVFVDQSGFGRWRLNGSSLGEVQNALRRRMVR